MSVIDILKDLEHLVTPISEKSSTLDDVLQKKINVLKTYTFQNVEDFDVVIANKFPECCDENPPTWITFIKILSDKLLSLKIKVENDDDNLFSISQQRLLKSSVEILVCLGILPHLNEGIGIPLNQRLSNKDKLLEKQVTPSQKQYVINITLYSLYNLFRLDIFNSIIIHNHLIDIISGSVQLILEKKSVDPAELKLNLQNLIENTYQPFVIEALMVMLGNKDVWKPLKRWLSSVLTDRLTAKGGLVATLRAILDITGGSKDSPHHWDNISVLAKLITTPKHISIYPQLFDILKCQNSDYKQVAVMSLQLLFESRPEDCDKYFISPLLEKITEPSSEGEFGEALETLHGCCALLTPWSLSTMALSKGFAHLIKLNATIRTSVSYLKSKASELAWAILSNEDADLEDLFVNAVFNDLGISYNLGSEGGVCATHGNDDVGPEEVADSILELFLNRGNPEQKNKFFKMLISNIVNDTSLEKQLVCSKMLSELCGDSEVQKTLSSDPLCILPFIKVLLENPDNYGAETVCLGLMVLGIVVDASSANNPLDWNQLRVLIQPLKNFKSDNVEANVIANELYDLITTNGSMRKKPKKEEKIKTSLEKALENTVDPLLPVRAHGIRQLGRLLSSKDPHALAKKETILYIFKENLKDEDSYLYLSCIEGLAVLSASFPDEILMTLIEEYQGKSRSVEERLKVGEVLLKVARILNEMSIIYKGELLNCFLAGCCDDEPLMRASSLSNLGEICKILSFRISAYIVEILECVRSIYETDRHAEARRSAVMVLTLLLKGLGENALRTLEPALLEIYRGLKKVYECDKDDITRLHAQLALEELRASTLVFLNPVRPLEKRIFVLDSPE